MAADPAVLRLRLRREDVAVCEEARVLKDEIEGLGQVTCMIAPIEDRVDAAQCFIRHLWSGRVGELRLTIPGYPVVPELPEPRVQACGVYVIHPKLLIEEWRQGAGHTTGVASRVEVIRSIVGSVLRVGDNLGSNDGWRSG